MKFVLVPVKDLSKANERLSSVLTQKERTRLAYTMLEDVFEAVYHCTIADKKVVVTLDQKAKERANKYGFEVINEFKQTSQSDSVDFAINICKKMGATSLLVIPGDAPLVSSNDIDYILGNEKDHSSVIMVPSRDNLGTNSYDVHLGRYLAYGL